MDIDNTLRDIRSELATAAIGNEEYAAFNKRIANTRLQVLGVRAPDLRRIAKAHAQGITAAELLRLIGAIDHRVFDEVLLIGLMIGYGKFSDEDRRDLTESFLPLCDSWAHIDMFVVRHKRYAVPFWWDYATGKLTADGEYVVRYGVILLMENFLTADYIDRVFDALRTVRSDEYYVKMAMAWLYAEAAVTFYEQTLREVQLQSQWVRNKALQKMTESRRFTPEQKDEIRALRIR